MPSLHWARSLCRTMSCSLGVAGYPFFAALVASGLASRSLHRCSPMQVPELPHELHVRIVNSGGKQYLIHTLLGEVVALSDGPWRLVFDDQGMGALLADYNTEEPTQWVSDLLESHAFRSSRPGYDGEQIFVMRGEETTWLRDLERLGSASVFARRTADGRLWQSEVYWHRIPKISSPMSCLWWCLPWWATAVYGKYGGKQGNFIGRHADIWRDAIAEFRIESASSHLRPSLKSRIASARMSNSVVYSNEMLSVEQEFTFSTLGLFLVTGSIATNKRLHKYRDNAILVLDMVCGKFLGTGDHDITFCDITLEVRSGRVDLGALAQSASGVFRQVLHRICKEEVSDIVAFIMCLFDDLQVSRRGSMVKELLRKGLVDIGCALSDIAECSKDDAMWKQNDHMSLPFLASPACKARRVFQSVKMATVRAVDETKGVKRVSSLLAAQGAMAKRGRVADDEEETALSMKSGATFETSAAYQYWLACRELGASTRNISMCMDGARVAGEEIQSCCVFSYQGQRAAWLPCQVPPAPPMGNLVSVSRESATLIWGTNFVSRSPFWRMFRATKKTRGRHSQGRCLHMSF